MTDTDLSPGAEAQIREEASTARIEGRLMPPNNYDLLDAEHLIRTVRRLADRIRERLGEQRGLHHVCLRLLSIAQQAKWRADWIGRPLYGYRLAAGIVVALIFLATVVPLFILRPDREHMDELSEFVQVLEPAVNVVVLLAAAVIFFVTMETRVKRKRALRALHELRSMAHIVDMHQLTKDPHRLTSKLQQTASSPKQDLSISDLCRYLDYCSEMLSLLGKIAVLYVQNFDDAVVTAAANEVEQLCTGLSRKIWQKLMIVSEVTLKREP